VTFPENLVLDFFPSTKHKNFVRWVWGEENFIFSSVCEGRRSCFCGKLYRIMKRRGEEEKETLCGVGEGGG